MQPGSSYSSKDSRSPSKGLRKRKADEVAAEENTAGPNAKKAKSDIKGKLVILEETQQQFMKARELWGDQSKKTEAVTLYAKCIKSFDLVFKLQASPPHFSMLKEDDAVMLARVFLEFGEAFQAYANTQLAETRTKYQ